MRESLNYDKFTLKGKFGFLIFFLFLLISSKTFSVSVYDKNIKVGWYYSAMFQEGMTDQESKGGYCYDYLQKIADYSNLHYEYVYGDWTTLLHKLQTGEIELLGGVSYSDDRKGTMLFPDVPMGSDQYYLYKHENDDSISLTKLSSLKNKKIGGITDNRMTLYTKKWLEDNNLDVEIVYFDNYDDEIEAFNKDEIQLITQTLNNAVNIKNVSILTKVGEEPVYMAISKYRRDLLLEINSSLSTVLAMDPFLLQNLQYKHYGTNLINRTMTIGERQWAKAHKKIVVGYLENYLPYSDTNKEGNVTGLITDVISGIFDSLNLNDTTIEYIGFTDYTQMLLYLKDERVDIAFPVGGNTWELEHEGIDATSPVINSSEAFFFKKNYKKEDIKRIAVNSNNQMMISYCKRNYPGVELVYYSSVEDCLLSVVTEKTDGTVLNNLRTELATGNRKFSGLSYVLLNTENNHCFGVNENNISLLLILNRGLRILGSSFGLDNSYKYMGDFYSYNAFDFIHENIVTLIIVVGSVFLLIIFLLVNNLKRKERNVKEVSALNKELNEAKQAAEQASNAKTIFLNNMSHDIRTPMNAILGFATLMENNKEKPDVVADYLGKIKKSGEYLLSIINNVLNMARIESGNATVELSFMDLRNAEIDTVTALEPLMKEKNQKFIVSGNYTHPYVFLDVAKHQEITMNLLSNAIKYTPEGGTIEMHMVELPCEESGYAYYELTISDNGIGMSPDFLEHIFESFSRERNTTDSKVVGTGLGMSIVKKLVTLLGGTITVESEINKGSKFTVRFKHQIIENPEKYKQKTDDKMIASILKGKRVLVAEDNDFNYEIAEDILIEQGLMVERAIDGVDCLEKITLHDPEYYNLIFMDIQMPNMNGYDTTLRIRQMEDRGKSKIPIIAMTANAFEEEKQKAFEVGMNAHIAKPIIVETVLEEIEKYMVYKKGEKYGY